MKPTKEIDAKWLPLVRYYDGRGKPIYFGDMVAYVIPGSQQAALGKLVGTSDCGDCVLERFADGEWSVQPVDTVDSHKVYKVKLA